MSVDLVSDEAIAAAFWELAEYPEKAPGNRLAFAAACAYIYHRAKELSAALPLLECGKGEAVAWMIRNKGDGELHWNEELCVFADAASAGEMAECLNDGDPPIWEALPLYTAPQPAAQQPAGDGWKLVPIEPHGQMARAARLQYEDDDDEGVVDWFAVVAAAIAAAPESKP